MKKSNVSPTSTNDDKFADENLDLLGEQLDGAANDTLNELDIPSVYGEQSVSGNMPDPESDDDMLLNSHQVGLRVYEDEESPQELNIAADVAAAEADRRQNGT
ncbi:MAG: hypothetical protein M3Q81_05030 [bacterium]|nr:hypothetical protein [bacterium]